MKKKITILMFILSFVFMASFSMKNKVDKTEKNVTEIEEIIEANQSKIDSTTKFIEIWKNLPLKTTPVLDTTNFDNSKEVKEFNSEEIKTLQLTVIYPNINKEGINYRFLPSYRVALSNKFYTLVLNVFKGEHELEAVLINYNLEEKLTGHKIIAYDEIAEGWSRKHAKIEHGTITVINEFYGNTTQIDSTLFHINSFGEINQIKTKFSSSLRPIETILLNQTYTDTIEFSTYNDDYDYKMILGEKNGKDVGIIYNWDWRNSDRYNFEDGETVKVTWRMDRIIHPGDEEILDFKERAIDAERVLLKNKTELSAIRENANGQDHYFITAKNGLNVRSSPDLSSKKTAKIPFGIMVEKIAETEKELIVNDNGKQVKGKFVKIKYNNYPYLISEETEGFEREGYVFDGYLKRRINNLVTTTKIDKIKYAALLQKASKETHEPKAINSLDAIKTILKNRVTWITEFESETYKSDDVLKGITTENGQKLVFNQNSIDFGFSEGQSGYYPEYDILVLEGGHGTDVCFSLETGETELTIGNPEYIIASPKNRYRLNGFFGGQECISYFFQKNENGKFVYLTAFNTDYDICTFKVFYWVNETSFIYKRTNYMIGAENEPEVYFMGKIKDND